MKLFYYLCGDFEDSKVKKVSSYELPLRGLSLGSQEFEYHLDDAFFAATEATDVLSANVDVRLTVTNHGGGILDLTFTFAGEIGITCDRCLEEMPLAIDTEYAVKVSPGDAYDDSGDDVIVVPATWPALDVTALVRDTVLLCIPVMHHHEEGGCNAEMTRLLEAHSGAVADDEATNAAGDEDGENGAVDPRWSALRKLKDNNK